MQLLSFWSFPLSMNEPTGEPSATDLACTRNPRNLSPPDPDRVTEVEQLLMLLCIHDFKRLCTHKCTAVLVHSRILLHMSHQSQKATTERGLCRGLVRFLSVPQGRYQHMLLLELQLNGIALLPLLTEEVIPI